MSAPRIAVIGIGNTLMGDDGAGVAVVEGLDPDRLGPSVEVVSGATAGMALMRYFMEYDFLVAIDAIACRAEPGAIFRFRPDDAGIMNLRSNNIHGMGIPYLITSARLKGIEPDVLVFAVNVACVTPNDRVLSPEVAGAVIRIRELVAQEVRSLLGRWHPAGPGK